MSAGVRAASLIWSSLTAAKRAAARAGLVRGVRLPVRVVSVGNIQAGGAGKTPLAARIAREGAQRGITVCIVTRGYHSRWEREGGVIAPGQETPATELCGDEAALLHELAPQAWIAVGADRVAAYQRAVERAGAGAATGQAAAPFGLVLLDDGFQNTQFTKDVEVVAVTSAEAGQCYFRDFASALDRADLVVWTKGDRRPDARGRPFVAAEYRLPAPPSGSGKLWVVTGVADGVGVVAQLRREGYRVEKHLKFGDHAAYTEQMTRSLLEAAGKDGARLVLTGKDWVKWRELGVRRDQVIVVEPAVHFREGESEWNRILWESRS